MSIGSTDPPAALSATGRWMVLIFAFLGWAFGGVHMAITSIVMRVATTSLVPADVSEGEIGQWFGRLVVAFLLGAAAGGYAFGFVGDRLGRARAMAASIAWYSVFSGVTYFAQNPAQLLVLRFLTCMGVGGMWPNGIALLSEAWPNVSRPILAGVMGTAANVGILCFAIVTTQWYVTAEDWRWTMLVGASPIALAAVSLLLVPESPRWLGVRRGLTSGTSESARAGLADIFRPPVLSMTVLGIALATIPLFGGWGVSNWGTAWASEAGDKPRAIEGAEDPSKESGAPEPTAADPALKSRATIARSVPGSVTSLLGGALAAMLGRRFSYGLFCACALACTQFLFRVEDPSDKTALFDLLGWAPPAFLFWNAALGFFSGFFFGWLPLCLPEMFPTRVRSTGAGVSFNWGRIITAAGILASGAALKEMFEGRYAQLGQVTGFVYALGIVVVLFVPKTSDQELRD